MLLLDFGGEDGNYGYRMTDEQKARLLAASKAASEGLARRNKVICDLHREGVSLRDIARALDMTHPGIRKIILKEEP